MVLNDRGLSNDQFDCFKNVLFLTVMENHYWIKRVKESALLNPVDRISEVLFGLIMVLSFTGAISASTDNRENVQALLWAALGCNIAWGLVDAIMYLMNIAIERGHSISIIKKIYAATNADEAGQLLKNEIAPGIAGLMTASELSELSTRLKKSPQPTNKLLITGTDMLAGFQIFVLVFVCTIPVGIPFEVIDDLEIAMPTSNLVAVTMLLIGGFLLGGYAGFRRGLTALIYAMIGVALVALTMALGG